MLQLTSANVNALFLTVLFNDGEDTTDHIPVHGVTQAFGLHPGRVASAKAKVGELLGQLDPSFFSDDGQSFLQLPFAADGKHWCEHKTAQELMVLGLATGQMVSVLPRELWMVLPGGVPILKCVR